MSMEAEKIQLTSLTKTAIVTRKIIRYSIFFLIFIVIARMVILTGIRIYRYINPVPPPPPTIGFGKLPSLPFPEKTRPENLNLVLETPDGTLPQFPEQIKVYFMPKLSSGLLSLETAKTKVTSLGYDPNGSKESQTIYNFSHLKVPANLRINTVTGVFSLSYDLSRDPSPIGNQPPASEVAKAEITSYLQTAGLMPTDLTGPTTPEYIRIEDGKMVQALSLSDAVIVKINFFRSPYEEYPSLTSEPGKGNVWFMVSGSTERDKIVISGEYYYFPVDIDKFETYPVKTAQAAWEELKAGGGYIAQSSAGIDPIKIRRVYIAYFDPGVPTEFFQPIAVFEGDGGFIAYVPLVQGQYYGN